MDEIIDIEYLETVLRRGVIVGFDSFGQDGYFSPTLKSRSDQEKMETLVALIERGYEDQLVLSMDMGKKHYLKRFGGMGYDHVLRRIIPRLRQIYGVTDVVMDKLLVTTLEGCSRLINHLELIPKISIVANASWGMFTASLIR